jgi:predicted metal-dependent enzyme (double-stranded beta helix superfamily)
VLLHALRTPSLRSGGASRTRCDIDSLTSSLIRPARRTAAPTPLGLPDLAALTRGVAAQVRTGAHEVVLEPDRRWYRRLYADRFVDVWLISWVTEQPTELHDHAGSLGALTVVSGVLDEHRWVAADGALRRRRLRAGRGATFALGHVHDVVNTQAEHAVSVHAYSPPLTAMSYYTVDGDGALRRTRSVLTDGGSA